MDETVPQREFTLHELRLLVELSGCFAPPAFYGAMDEDFVPIDDESAFRMIAVMTRL